MLGFGPEIRGSGQRRLFVLLEPERQDMLYAVLLMHMKLSKLGVALLTPLPRIHFNVLAFDF